MVLEKSRRGAQKDHRNLSSDEKRLDSVDLRSAHGTSVTGQHSGAIGADADVAASEEDHVSGIRHANDAVGDGRRRIVVVIVIRRHRRWRFIVLLGVLGLRPPMVGQLSE